MAGWGAAIGSAAGAAFGGILDSKSARKQVKLQKKFAQQGISWRVADAKRAGLHPLYALQAQGLPQYSPVQSNLGETLAAAGQDIGRAIGARLTPAQKQMVQYELQKQQIELQNLKLEGQKIGADTRYVEAATRQFTVDRLRYINDIIGTPIAEPASNTKESGGNGTVFGGQAIRTSTQVPEGFIEPKAPVVYSGSGNTGIAAGTTPAMREFRLPSGMPVLLPGGMAGDAQEALEAITESVPVMYAVFRENVAHYGPQWGDEFIRNYVPGGEAYVSIRQRMGRFLYDYRSGKYSTEYREGR